MPVVESSKNSTEFCNWFEKNQENLNAGQVFVHALDLIRSLESKSSTNAKI